jgi:hypothetical protein
MPWWRKTDKDDLASLVAQKSLDYIGNCDLPPPQKVHIRKYPCAHSGSFQHDNTLASSLDWKAQIGCISSATGHVQGCPKSEGMPGKQRGSTEGQSLSGSDKACRYFLDHVFWWYLFSISSVQYINASIYCSNTTWF